MHSLNTLIATAFATLALGLLIGMLIASRRNNSKKVQQDLKNHISDIQQQQQDYQQEVSSHFTQTATLINQLTNSYRDVHNHLAQGAELLAGGASGERLQRLPSQPEESRDTLSPDADPETISGDSTANHNAPEEPAKQEANPHGETGDESGKCPFNAGN